VAARKSKRITEPGCTIENIRLRDDQVARLTEIWVNCFRTASKFDVVTGFVDCVYTLVFPWSSRKINEREVLVYPPLTIGGYLKYVKCLLGTAENPGRLITIRHLDEYINAPLPSLKGKKALQP
jgi:hypothetical protein